MIWGRVPMKNQSSKDTFKMLSRQVLLDNLVISQKGGWLCGSSLDFHTPKLEILKWLKINDLVLSAEVKYTPLGHPRDARGTPRGLPGTPGPQ